MKHILFDLDETLYDHRQTCIEGIKALQGLCPSLRVKSAESLEKAFWNLLCSHYLHVLSGKLSNEQARIERIALLFKECGTDAPAEKLDELCNIYSEAYYSSMSPVPGAFEVLDALKDRGHTIGVVTNGFVQGQMNKIKSCRIDTFIDHITISEEAGVAKPDPRIYLEALKKCGAEPSDTIMIGDTWDSDILGSYALGIKPVWYNRRNEPCPNEKVAEVIYELKDLLRIIDNWQE